HSTNWLSGIWKYLGTDWNGSDGWSMHFNPSSEPEGTEAALYIQAYDMAGNWAGAAAWNLGIDKTPPTTAMKHLGATQPSNAFLLEWTASDNLSGIDYVELQEQMNSNGSWTTYPLIDESEVNHWIVGVPGNNYAYRLRGVDHSGNSETYPATAETGTSVPVADVICFAMDSYDTGGDDNSPARASLIYADGASQMHNYCNPLAANRQNDEDWIKLNVVQGVHYRIESLANSLPSASRISLYAQDGTTLIAETIPVSFGDNTYLMWAADRTAQVYIRLRHLDGRVIGNDVGATISVKTGILYLLPLLNR
ncbi:MAG TPA: hypothetical protein VF831_05530, partial [Anaerolineales bacterium]